MRRNKHVVTAYSITACCHEHSRVPFRAQGAGMPARQLSGVPNFLPKLDQPLNDARLAHTLVERLAVTQPRDSGVAVFVDLVFPGLDVEGDKLALVLRPERARGPGRAGAGRRPRRARPVCCEEGTPR